jgi:hypothetical protein
MNPKTGTVRPNPALIRVPSCPSVVSIVFNSALLLAMAFAAAAATSSKLDWQDESGHRRAQLSVPAAGKPGFSLLPSSSTGIGFTNVLPLARNLTNQVLLNGSGLAAGDVDGDGLCDLYFAALDRPNALYRNLGDWKFQDIAGEAGVACAGLTSSGAALVDLDGDDDLDLIVNTVGHGTHVYVNDSKGRFTELTVLNPGKAGMSLALGDLDGDGFLDLYVTNYRTQALMDMPNTVFNFKLVNGQRVISRVNGRSVTEADLVGRYRVGDRGGIEENGEPDEVYRNLGGKGFASLSFTNGAFVDEDGQALALLLYDWGLSVVIRDLNQDGLPDIWVCNDFDSPERIWLNLGGGRFRAAPRLAVRKSSHFSMGIDVADLNRDGFDDIFVVDMLSRDHVMRMDMQGDRNPPVPVIGRFDDRPDYMINTLFLNRGDGTYAEIAQLAGVFASEWSWTPAFLDVDLDGYEDLLISNGHERAARSLDVSEHLKALRAERQLTPREIFENRKLFPRQNSPNVAFRNRGDLTFEDTTSAWGFGFDGVSHGVALADLDNDGDLDVAVNNLNDPACVYRNNASAPRLAIRLKGAFPNTRGIGARIKVLAGTLPPQSQEMIAGGRYLSSDEALRVFAAGAGSNDTAIEVTWRSGKRTVVRATKGNSIYEINEGGASPPVATPTPQPGPVFQDVSELIAHTHQDEPFDDFARQPLLPGRLSQLGPGVTWADFDADGWEDLVIASGKGGQLAGYRNNQRGGFERLMGPPFSQPITRDQSTVLLWRKKPGEVALLAGSANYEDGFAGGAVAREFNLGLRTVRESLPGHNASTGPMALADFSGDGQLDLFVGGRVIAGRWPEPASSLLFRGAGEAWTADPGNTKALEQVGLVSGAVFSDLDADGDPDLILACEWGSLRLFRNTNGKFAEATKELGLDQFKGCWNGVTSGDFDGDGRLDIVASNLGRNTRYQAHRAKPLELLFGDFSGDESLEVIEAHHDPALQKLVPDRQLDFLGQAMPFLRTRFTSHLAFGRLGVEEILGDKWASTRRLQANWFETTVFLNRGDRFEARALPVEAQMAPAFGACAADFDGDGAEDVFLSQNFFSAQPDIPRHDAGRGLWLRGDGQGGFKAVPGQESGITIYGEQRGAALCDFDHDGRTDLAVSQNGAATKLYRNVRAKPGLRVRLAGPSNNPDAIGAVMRLVTAGKMGPAREIHAGSGYWSQDGVVQVLAGPAAPGSVWVRWPGGKTTDSKIPSGAQEITVDVTGATKIHR